MKRSNLAAVAALALAGFAHGQNIPDAPQPIIAAATRPAKVQPFTADRTNRALMGGDLAARITDAVSTVELTGGSHPKGRETLLPSRLAASGPGMVAYSVAVSLGLDYAAAYEWRHGHRKIARALLVVDTAQDGACAVHNLMILGRSQQTPAAGFTVHPSR